MQAFLAPITGTAAFLARPALWKAVVTASPMVTIVFAAVAVAALVWYWPIQEGVILWPQVADWVLVLAGAFLVLVPFCRGRAGVAVMVPYFESVGKHADSSARRGVGAKFVYFFKTIPWRVIWALAAFGGWQIHPYVGLGVGLWGVGHLTMLDAAEQALLVGGVEADKRSQWLRDQQRNLIIAGITAGILFGLSSLVVLGWVVWLPACFLAAAQLVKPALVAAQQKNPEQLVASEPDSAESAAPAVKQNVSEEFLETEDDSSARNREDFTETRSD